MKPEQERHPVRVGLISLGCAKNLVDAEIMLGALLKDGVEITNDAARADAVIVNTCSFIDAAQEESVDTILESAEVRATGRRGQALIVSGCLPQRFREELPMLLPEVDAFMGIDQVAQVSEIVRQAMARRAEKARSPKSEIRNPKSKVIADLAELDKDRQSEAAEKAQSLRGTERFGKTRTAVTPLTQHATRSTPGHLASSIQHPAFVPLVAVHARPTFIPDYATPRFRLTPRHFAYVKIAEGCNHPCSFCIIPRMRGSHRSRPLDDLVREARQLLADGAKELNLISQDSTYYGLDLRLGHSRAIASPEKFAAAIRALNRDGATLSALLRELNALPGDFWIRILYTHPAHWTDELITTIAACRKVARYVDIPLQHIHENMLERMRRETSREYIVDLLRQIRADVPGIALRTTFIVGFPGETEACFQTLLKFIRETKFERLGVFTYSKEDGTRAGAMAGQIPDRVKRHRRDLAMAAQREVACGISESFVGRTIKVLVEGEASAKQLQAANTSSWEHDLIRACGNREAALGTREFLVARGEADAPGIDGRVFVRGKLPAGEFAPVRVLGHTDYDLIAAPA